MRFNPGGAQVQIAHDSHFRRMHDMICILRHGQTGLVQIQGIAIRSAVAGLSNAPGGSSEHFLTKAAEVRLPSAQK